MEEVADPLIRASTAYKQFTGQTLPVSLTSARPGDNIINSPQSPGEDYTASSLMQRLKGCLEAIERTSADVHTRLTAALEWSIHATWDRRSSNTAISKTFRTVSARFMAVSSTLESLPNEQIHPLRIQMLVETLCQLVIVMGAAQQTSTQFIFTRWFWPPKELLRQEERLLALLDLWYYCTLNLKNP